MAKDFPRGTPSLTLMAITVLPEKIEMGRRSEGKF
jgi:hypothetical protein